MFNEEIPCGFSQPLLLNEPTDSARSVEIILPKDVRARSPLSQGEDFTAELLLMNRDFVVRGRNGAFSDLAFRCR